MSDFPAVQAMWGYGLAAIIFAIFAIRFFVAEQSAQPGLSLRTTILVCAVIMSALWAGSMLVAIKWHQAGNEIFWSLARVSDVARMAGLLAFLSLLVTGDSAGKEKQSSVHRVASQLWIFALLFILLFAAAVLPQPMPWVAAADIDGRELGFTAFYPWLGLSILGLVLTEQLYQRMPKNRVWAIKPLIIGLGCMFAYDLVVFSGALLFHQVDPEFWAARGIAHALVMFFIAIATRRNMAWTLDLHVSRGVVFHSTAIFVAGCYLLIVALTAYWVNYFGGEWGKTLQIVILFTAVLFLATLAMSGALRARLRVFISKNLFSYRYDYRKEWLQFTTKLGTAEEGESLYQQVIRAHADLVESVGGAIWLDRGGVMCEMARLNMPPFFVAANDETAADVAIEKPPQLYPAAASEMASLVSFLQNGNWVIQIDEVLKEPARYPNLVLPTWLVKRKDAWIVVPLPNPNSVDSGSVEPTNSAGYSGEPKNSELIGFVVLARPRTPIDINWEVLDLLKTASRQAASYLAQHRAQESLVELEKFDAFNRMSAFVVHDLKNLISQLVLLLKNAERHRDNPEFQNDMLETIDHVVGRMNSLMLQLRTGTTPVGKPCAIELGPIIKRIVSVKSASNGVQSDGSQSNDVTVEAELAPNLRILAHEDRIERVIGHVVQNAIEATVIKNPIVLEANKRVERVMLRAYVDEKNVFIDVIDSGVGMSEEFIREYLFHPFQTTKAQGMGIGMFESFQYIGSIRGRISVTSALNVGTTFSLIFPLLSAAAKYEHAQLHPTP